MSAAWQRFRSARDAAVRTTLLSSSRGSGLTTDGGETAPGSGIAVACVAAASADARDEHQQRGSAAQDWCIRRTLQKSVGARTATPSRRGDSGRRSVGRRSSERRGDVVLAQPQRCGAQQAAIAGPSRPGSAEQQSVLPTPRCCSRPDPNVRGLGAARLLRLSRLRRPRYAFATVAIAPAPAIVCLLGGRSSHGLHAVRGFVRSHPRLVRGRASAPAGQRFRWRPMRRAARCAAAP